MRGSKDKDPLTNRDAVAARALVVFEDNVGARVDSNAIVLVLDDWKAKLSTLPLTSRFKWKRLTRVLDSNIRSRDIETVCVGSERSTGG